MKRFVTSQALRLRRGCSRSVAGLWEPSSQGPLSWAFNRENLPFHSEAAEPQASERFITSRSSVERAVVRGGGKGRQSIKSRTFAKKPSLYFL